MTPTKNGSTDAKQIYLGIGYVVYAWEFLETRLFFYYSTLASGDISIDLQAYSAINAFRSRIEVARRVSNQRLNEFPDLKAESGRMLDRVEKHSRKRNQIVHGQMTQAEYSKTGRDGQVKKVSGLYVSNSVYLTDLFHPLEKRYGYNHVDLIDFANVLITCRGELNTLTDKVAAALGRQP